MTAAVALAATLSPDGGGSTAVREGGECGECNRERRVQATPEHGVAEQAGFWQEQTPLGKMWGRALYDWRRTDRLVIRDYKTYDGQQGADPDAFIKGIIGTGKDVQDPWYSRGFAAIAGVEAGETIPWDAVDFKSIVQDPSGKWWPSHNKVAQDPSAS